MIDYQTRVETEAATGHPALPCYHCGRDEWTVERPFRQSKHDQPKLFLAVCNHCHVGENAMHIDGAWMGARQYSKFPGCLCDFVTGYAAYLRETK